MEKAADDGSDSVIYAYGDVPSMGIRRGWAGMPATAQRNTLVVSGARFTARYELSGTDQSDATCTRGSVTGRAIITRATLAALSGPDPTIPWTRGQSVTVPTNLRHR